MPFEAVAGAIILIAWREGERIGASSIAAIAGVAAALPAALASRMLPVGICRVYRASLPSLPPSPARAC